MMLMRWPLALALASLFFPVASAIKCTITQDDITKTPFGLELTSSKNWTTNSTKSPVTYNQFCFELSEEMLHLYNNSLKSCEAAGYKPSDCCVDKNSTSPKKPFKPLQIQLLTAAGCTAKPSLKSFKKSWWTANPLATKKGSREVIGRLKKGIWTIKITRKARVGSHMAICINIPQDAGNACRTASQMCGGASCSFTIVTSKFKPSGSKKKQTCCVKGNTESSLASANNATNLPVVPHNPTACRDRPLSDFATTSTSTWLAVGVGEACSATQYIGLTCSQVCAQRGRKCDPCAISKLNCQDAYYYVAKQARLSNFLIATVLGDSVNGKGTPGVLGYTPFCKYEASGALSCQGPWLQTSCATASEPNKILVSGTKLGSRVTKYHPGLTNEVYVMGSTTKNCLVADRLWYGVYNFYDPSQASTYIDPKDACDLPVATILSGTVSELFTGAFCFCTS